MPVDKKAYCKAWAAANLGKVAANRLKSKARAAKKKAADPEAYAAKRAEYRANRVAKLGLEGVRAEFRASSKRWRARNLEKVAAYEAAYRAANAEVLREKALAYARAHPEVSQNSRLRRMREDFAAFRADENARNRDWCSRNPEAVAAKDMRRRAAGRISAEELRGVRAMADGICAYCFKRRRLTVDHCDPISRGGTNDPSNLVMACRSCNSAKGALTPLEFMLKQRLLAPSS